MASSYEVYISEASDPGTAIIRVTGISSTSYTAAADLAPGNYRVWVRAFGPGGERTAWSLNKTSDLSIDAITRPELNRIGSTADRTPTFAWAAVAGAFRYQLYVAPVSNTSSPAIDRNDISATSYTPTTELAPGNYRAWVRAISGASELSDWSVAVTFTITALDSS